MSDVSCRFLGQLVLAARARGLAIDPIRIELGLPEPSPNEAREFVPWDTAAALMTRCQDLAGGPEGMRELGRHVTDPGTVSGVLSDILRLALGPRQLYAMIARWAGPAAFRNLEVVFERISGGRLQLELRLPASQCGCTAVFHGNAGFLEVAPRMLGLGDSVVESRIEPRRGVFVITPPTTTSAFSRLRRLLALFRGSDSAMHELQARHDAITRQRAELEAARTALAHAEKRFTDVFHESPLPMVILTENAERLIDVNARFLEDLGMTREDVLSTPVEDLPVWPSPEQSASTLARIRGKPAGDGIDIAFRDSRGQDRHGIVSVSRSNLDGERVLLIQLLDVTERREAELALKRGEARHRAILQALPDTILLFARDGTCLDAHVPKKIRDALRLRDPVGRTPPELGASPTMASQVFELIDRVCESGEPEFSELALSHEGLAYKFEARFAPCGQDQVLAIVRDVTERQQLEESLRQSQKMEALGQLAGGVAHDFNNLLTAIIGYAEIQLGEVEPDGAAAEASEQILAAAERAARLTQQLLTFGRRRIIQARCIDLNDTIMDMLELLERLIGEHIRVETDLCEESATISCDPVEIEQVLMNLALNARDAMPEGGTLRLSTHAATTGPRHTSNGATGDGRFVRLRVSDTGVGMDEDVRRRAFEPFFTTKPSGHSTGLGLATVFGIVRRAGGAVRLLSEPGEGTTLEVQLPRVDGRPDDLPCPSQGRTSGRGETLLIVEDEKPLRELLGAALARDGYRVLLAGDGLEALDLESEHGAEIDALVTDAVMPRMGGVELVAALRRRRPQMPALFISGYPDRPVPRECRVLEKPFRMPVLAQSVREMLDARGASGPA